MLTEIWNIVWKSFRGTRSRALHAKVYPYEISRSCHFSSLSSIKLSLLIFWNLIQTKVAKDVKKLQKLFDILLFTYSIILLMSICSVKLSRNSFFLTSHDRLSSRNLKTIQRFPSWKFLQLKYISLITEVNAVCIEKNTSPYMAM